VAFASLLTVSAAFCKEKGEIAASKYFVTLLLLLQSSAAMTTTTTVFVT
jgi:hypothetical protein